MIANKERAGHGSGGDGEVLKDESEEKEDRDDGAQVGGEGLERRLGGLGCGFGFRHDHPSDSETIVSRARVDGKDAGGFGGSATT
jgi:hypothetical protein